MDLTYLLKDRYDGDFVRRVYQWPSITQTELRSGQLSNGEPLPAAVRLTYEDKNTYKLTAKEFGLMDDFRVSPYALILSIYSARLILLRLAARQGFSSSTGDV